MARLGQTQNVEVSGKSGSKFISTSSRWTASTDKCSVLDMFPEFLTPIPNAFFIYHAS